MAAAVYDAPAAGQLSNASATGAAFELKGGLYAYSVLATWGGGNVVLQSLGPDGSTWGPVFTALTATPANQPATAYLPPGQYRWAVTTATAVYASVSRVPVA